MAKRRQTVPESVEASDGIPSLNGGLQEIEHFLQEVEAGTEAPDASLEAMLKETTAEGKGEDDPQAQRIAESLGQPVEALQRVQADRAAGEDAGQVFYTFSLSGMTLAIRPDGLRAYLTQVSTEMAEKAKIVAALQPYRLVDINVPVFKKVTKAKKSKSKKSKTSWVDTAGTWIKVAEGRLPVPGQSERFEYLDPSQPGQGLPPEILGLISIELDALRQSEGLDEAAAQKVRGLSVVPGEVLARTLPAQEGQPGQDVFGREVPPPEVPALPLDVGLNVTRSSEGECRAERYGYVCLLENRLSVVSPLWIDGENSQVYWLVLDEHPQPVTLEMVQQDLADLGVVEGIQEEQIQSLAARVREGHHQPGAFLIATGTKPQDGQDARVEMLVDMNRRVGKEREDGSIDFREVNFTPPVQANQSVARRTPPTLGTAGRDVKGNLLPAQDGQDQLLTAGDNIRMEREGDVEQFFSTINGALKLVGDELSAVEVLTINGDVSFSTGNLHFGGEIIVNGSVVQGFSVKAGGSVTITGMVEAGGTVMAQGDITVGHGIVGRKTKMVAQGDVHGQFVQEATVVAGKDIVLGNYVYHAHLRAGGKVSVAKGKGKRGGSIAGGQTWALQGVDVHQAGSPAGTLTPLIVGLDTKQAQQLDRLKNRIETCHEHILRLLKQFGLTDIELGQIQMMIKAATGPRRKILAHHAQKLGQLTQVHQQVLAERQQLEEQVGGTLQETEIAIREMAFPGVTIRLGEHQRQLTEPIQAPRFHLADDKLVER